MSMILSSVASLILVSAPYCPAGHSQAECDAIWAATQAVAATQRLGEARSVSAGATAYMAQQSAEAPAMLPPAVRLRLLNSATDILALQAGTSVLMKRVVYFTGGSGLMCGTALFDGRLQTFYANNVKLKRGATPQEMAAAGCNGGGGVLLANY